MSHAEVERLLAENGFTLVRQRRHKIYKHPTGRIFTCPSTPSDYRGWKNSLHDLQRLLASGRPRGIFDVPAPTAPKVALYGGTAPSPSPFRERSRGILAEKFARMRKHQVQHQRPRRTRRPQIVLPRPTPVSPAVEAKPTKLCFTSMRIIEAALPKLFEPAKVKLEDFSKADQIVAQSSAEAQTYFDEEVAKYNRVIDRCARSATDRLYNAIRDIRRHKRVKKSRTRTKLYEAFVRILERNDTEIGFENEDGAVHAAALWMTETLMLKWSLIVRMGEDPHYLANEEAAEVPKTKPQENAA